MRLTIVGSADAFNAVGRSHSCYLLEGAERPLMVDFGATALSALRRLGREPTDLGGLALTHLHGDHIGATHHLAGVPRAVAACPGSPRSPQPPRPRRPRAHPRAIARSPARRRSRLRRRWHGRESLDRETDVDDVAVFDDVLFAFE